MITKVQKWGNSLAVRIPKHVAGDLHSGSSVEVSREGEALTVRPAKNVQIKLEDLVSRITSQHLHRESDWGSPAGNESW